MAYTNDDLYNLINFAIRKDKKGQPLTRERYSLILNTSGREYQEILYDQYERTNEMSDSLRRFKVEKTGAQLSFTGYAIDLPTNYVHWGALYYKKDGTTVKPVEKLTDDTFVMRQDSYIEAPSSSYPVCKLSTDYIKYLPQSLDQNNFTFDYLRYPDTPFYDYYIDVNGVPHYLAAGAVHTWTTGEEDSSGNVHTTGDADWNSLTVELDFNDEDKLKVAAKMMQAVGVPINDAGVFTYAEQLKNES